jgi:hypothetical protein
MTPCLLYGLDVPPDTPFTQPGSQQRIDFGGGTALSLFTSFTYVWQEFCGSWPRHRAGPGLGRPRGPMDPDKMIPALRDAFMNWREGT